MDRTTVAGCPHPSPGGDRSPVGPHSTGPLETFFRNLELTIGDRAAKMTNKHRGGALLQLLTARHNAWIDEDPWTDLIRDHLVRQWASHPPAATHRPARVTQFAVTAPQAPSSRCRVRGARWRGLLGGCVSSKWTLSAKTTMPPVHVAGAQSHAIANTPAANTGSHQRGSLSRWNRTTVMTTHATKSSSTGTKGGSYMAFMVPHRRAESVNPPASSAQLSPYSSVSHPR